MTLVQTKPKPSFPNYEATEDFLDFSKWKLPSERVVTKRLKENLRRFGGNYLLIYLVLSFVYAALMNLRILAAAVTIAVGGLIVRYIYFYIYLLEASTNNYHGLEKRKSVRPLSKTSTTACGGIAAVLVLYKFSVITPLIMTFLFTMKIASIHAIARPFVGEHAFLLRTTSSKVNLSEHQ